MNNQSINLSIHLFIHQFTYIFLHFSIQPSVQSSIHLSINPSNPFNDSALWQLIGLSLDFFTSFERQMFIAYIISLFIGHTDIIGPFITHNDIIRGSLDFRLTTLVNIADILEETGQSLRHGRGVCGAHDLPWKGQR